MKPFDYDKKENAEDVDSSSNNNAPTMGHWLFFIQRWHNNTPAPSNCRGPIYYQGDTG